MNENNTNENIVIPIKIERMKLWTRWSLQATTWLVCLGLLAASAAVTASAALAWLVSGSEVILALGVGGGLLLGLAGVWHLLHRLDLAVKHLRSATPGVEGCCNELRIRSCSNRDVCIVRCGMSMVESGV